MNKLVLLPLIVASTLSYGADKLTCEQLTGWETAGYKVLMKYSAEVENVTPMSVKLKNLNLQYNIEGETLDDPENWGMGTHSYVSVTNTEGYNPRKYKNHSKFEILLDTRDSYGSVDLIIPTKNLNMKTNSQFKAYAIMTAISDHMGWNSSTRL